MGGARALIHHQVRGRGVGEGFRGRRGVQCPDEGADDVVVRDVSLIGSDVDRDVPSSPGEP